MKNINTFQKIAIVILIMAFSSSIYAQARLVKVNPATQEVTIKNFNTSGNIDVSTWWLCVFPAYTQISAMTGANLDLAPGTSVTFTNSIPINTADDELGLYHTGGNFGLAANMADYLQWGSAGHPREGVANTAGIWTTGTFINVSAPFNYSGNGSQNGVAFWDTSLGLEDFGLNTQFLVSPNPASNSVTINFGKTIQSGEMVIADMLGKTIYTKKLSNVSSDDLDVALWSQGLYFISLQTNEGAKTKRFLKK
ncbi:MAG: T9SS type A sorting domain-containing protein [Flavobacteriaceae bacterium]|nr:T9SS type A sorting domain-containing protein [Flavobacteriaceae bacterium]